MEKKHHFDFDYIIIGSGFGGSVSACRLTEKGYKVAVLEMGKRYTQDDFPETTWNLKKYFWIPLVRFFGFFRMTLFRHAWVLSGVGVGGGSLVYANTLLSPPDSVWKDTHWSHLKDWKNIMKPFYTTARKMLGANKNSYLGDCDRVLKEAADEQGFGDTFYTTDVGVYFGEPGKTVADPYFGGEGPDRTGCIYCGGCMAGCRHGAKNTLDKNYLYLAEKGGTQVFAQTKVVDIKPLYEKEDGSEGYEVITVSSTGFFRNPNKFTARGVIFSAGVLGTVKLMLDLKEKGSLPHLSDTVGNLVRTNSESIIGVRMHNSERDMSKGIAIGSGIHIDDHTHIEAVRYSRGSDSMGSLTTLLTRGQPGVSRIFSWLGVIISNPLRFIRMLNPFGFAHSTIILLAMQTVDSSIKLKLKRSWWVPFKKHLQTEGPKIPAYIPQANVFAEKLAQKYNGTPLTGLTEIFFNVPTTAHILGGAVMGKDPEEGVIDSQNLVFNYKNMLVCDGSMIGANLGVNPALTITALTEHAMSHIPNNLNVHSSKREH